MAYDMQWYFPAIRTISQAQYCPVIPSSVGKATSAGCIRLFNQDIMDLFDEIPNGTRVKVRSRAESLALEGQMIEQPNGYLARASSVQTAAAPAQ